MPKSQAKKHSSLLPILEERFKNNISRHPTLKWEEVEKKLTSHADALNALEFMEETGGEPDVIEILGDSGKICFVDCSSESPKGRRSLCYDGEALLSRKEHKPRHSAEGLAEEMHLTLLSENNYIKLQELENFDNKTSSWLHTPTAIRQLGGAIFGDRRFGRVFIYHNGAESYYGGRGFRAAIWV